MGKIVEKKKKKKGRPSLLDLQKRTLKQQQQQQKPTRNVSNSNSNNNKNSTLNSSHNYKSATPTHLRRSTRRNPTSSSPGAAHHHHDDDDDGELNGKRREKKLKLVLKLPPSSASFNSNGSDSDSDREVDKNNTVSYHKKRKINAIGDGSGFGESEKGGQSVSGAKPTNNVQDLGPSTPLPDKKLLLFILDRLQKKDTYDVFSEPVDPEELPDYHEVIEHPMDFGTVRNKLSSEAYANLEQFEKDVFLICSNAMQYNAPDTIYFRQARSIQELAKKNFENLRQDSDDNETEPKVVRRGRPPNKNFKKPLGRPSLDRAGLEFSSDATLATGGESTIWSTNDLRKGPHLSDKSGFVDSVGRCHGSRNDDKVERNDEATAIFKNNSMKHGKKQFALDENRRNTYKQFHPSNGGRGSSVLSTFDAERKQLMAVGLLSEHGYARSLARFAANISPVAWKIASKRIERSLPPGVKFGPGWVGENDIPPQRPLLLSSPPPDQPLPLQRFFHPENSCAVATLFTGGPKEEFSEKPGGGNLSEKDVPSIHSASEGHLSNPPCSSASMSTPLLGASKSEHHTKRAEAVEGLNSQAGFNMPNSSIAMIRPRPPLIHPGMNGFKGTYGFNLAAQMGKLIGAARPAGHDFQSSQMVDMVSRTNTNFVRPATATSLNPVNPKLSENSNSILPNSEADTIEGPVSRLQPRPSWPGLSSQPKPDSRLSPHQKSDSVPPDLNVRFQSAGSPSSSRVDSAQPDLALQL